jgi:hypothetical protein
MTRNETEASREAELKELAYTNRWLIHNRWGMEEHQAYAERLADKIVALATGTSVEPLASPEPEPAATSLEPPTHFAPP